MTMKRTLKTVDEIIDAFGGNSVVGRWLSVGPNAISNWRIRQDIPSGYHLRIWLEAQELGYRIDPKLFGVHYWPPLKSFHDREVA